MSPDPTGGPSALRKAALVLSRTLRLLFHGKSRNEIQEHIGRMREDGVDMRDAEARRAWIRAHRQELTNLQGRRTDERTSVRKAPKVGRNTPCPCGSGKKYKRCCGT